MSRVPSKDRKTDMFTKPLPAENFIMQVSQHENPIAAFGGVRVSTYESKGKSTSPDTYDDMIVKVNLTW